MKVLVVDDNVAIQEILKDILIENGHIVKIAGSISEAVETILDFRPEAILLDAVVNDEDGLQILARAHDLDKSADLSTILVKGVNDEAPHDNPFIKATVNKPFKSSDISNALSTLIAKKEEERIAREGAKKKKFGGLKFGRGDKKKNAKKTEDIDASAQESGASDSPLFGKSYVFFEKEPEKVYEMLKIFNPTDYSILVVSSDNLKAVVQKLGVSDLEVATLSGNGRGKTMDIRALGTLMVFIKKFIDDHDNPIVVISDFSEIVDSNGLNHSLVFLHQLITKRESEKPVSFLVSVDQSILTVKDRNILLGDMAEYTK